MSSVIQSPTTRTSIEQKLKARNCALMLKNGSPKLREMLRDQCRSKMKESRADSFALSRNITIEKKQLINKIIREEMAYEIDSDIELHEIIMREICENWEQWQSEEYERSFEYVMDTDEQVFCPTCEINLVSLQENIISCTCGLRLYYPKTLPEFYEKIQTALKLHDLRNCFDRVLFYTEPKVGFNVLALNAICTNCDYFEPIIELI